MQVIWLSLKDIPAGSFQCGYCGNWVGTDKGYIGNIRGHHKARHMVAAICPRCNYSSNFIVGDSGEYLGQTPAPMRGNNIEYLPEEVSSVYNEVRKCTQAGAYTACVLLCRKLLMHMAVEHGADEHLNFYKYVEYLSDAGYVPPNGKNWVHQIRTKGNEATHEILVMTETQAMEIIAFVEMLLKFNYEFPARINKNHEND